MIAAGALLTGTEQAVREFFAVVSQHLADSDQAGLAAILFGFIWITTTTGGAVNGHEERTARGLVGHLRQISNVHVQKPGIIGLTVCARSHPWSLAPITIRHAAVAGAAGSNERSSRCQLPGDHQ